MEKVHCYFKKDNTTPFLDFKNANGILKEMGQKNLITLSFMLYLL